MAVLRVARWIQHLFFVVGLVTLAYCVATWLDSRLRQYEANRDLARMLIHQNAGAAPGLAIPDGGLIGRVEIPNLHISAAVFQGTDSSILGHGVGHVAGTVLPGQPGNVALAAHRDTFFRSLRSIRRGDRVRVMTEMGTRTYQVQSTEVVNPTDTEVLAPTAKPTLTLITCFPFYYVGHAPKRFIVRAEEMRE